MNDWNNTKIELKLLAQFSEPGVMKNFKIAAITAFGKTPIKIPWAEPFKTLFANCFAVIFVFTLFIEL
jgi:hypothetical protein